jgi:hypothetical protein
MMAHGRFFRLAWLAPWVFAGLPRLLLAQEEAEEIHISDNSFLIEEAFNQEQGVVQHIFNWVPSWGRVRGVRHSTFDFVFTQEWPIFSQTHQFSYTIPMLYSAERFGSERTEAQGFGDMLLNYRLQVFDGKDNTIAFAPRFSVILPTGDVAGGLGLDRVGYQVNLPFSKETQRWAFHFNAGVTHVPGVTVGVSPELPFEGRDLTGYNLGGSAIYYLRPDFNLMLETLALWDQAILPDGSKDHLFQMFLSPGFRWAPYTEGDTQWVVGVGVPIGLTRDTPDISLFLYMSFEHRIHKKRGS